MKRREAKRKPLSLFRRNSLVLIGVMIAASGIVAFVRGNLHYSNYWGGAVFAPNAILIGGLVIVVAFRWGK